MFAASVKSDPKLAKGFNLIGHSQVCNQIAQSSCSRREKLTRQGGLLSRAYVERFNDPPVYNLISWAGPMDGQYGVPDLNAMYDASSGSCTPHTPHSINYCPVVLDRDTDQLSTPEIPKKQSTSLVVVRVVLTLSALKLYAHG